MKLKEYLEENIKSNKDANKFINLIQSGDVVAKAHGWLFKRNNKIYKNPEDILKDLNEGKKEKYDIHQIYDGSYVAEIWDGDEKKQIAKAPNRHKLGMEILKWEKKNK